MAAPHSPPPAYAAYGPPVPGPYVPAPGGLPHPGLAHPHPHAHPRSPDAYAPPQPGFPPHAAAMAAAVAPARPEPPPGRVEEWLSAGFYSGLQRSVESPYTPLGQVAGPHPGVSGCGAVSGQSYFGCAHPLHEGIITTQPLPTQPQLANSPAAHIARRQGG